MKRIKEMIENSPTKWDAMQMLEIWRIFGNVTDDQYQKGRDMIRKYFYKSC